MRATALAIFSSIQEPCSFIARSLVQVSDGQPNNGGFHRVRLRSYGRRRIDVESDMRPIAGSMKSAVFAGKRGTSAQKGALRSVLLII